MSMQEDGRLPVLYLPFFKIEGYKCFKDYQFLNLGSQNLNPVNWTIILGNNGTGKTSLLEAIELTFPVERRNSPKSKHTRLDFEGVERLPKWFDLPESLPLPLRMVEAFFNFSSEAPLEYPPSLIGLELPLMREKQYPSITWWMPSIDSFNVPNQPINVYFSYWATRKMGREVEVTETEYIPTNQRELINAEEWLAQLDYAILRGVPDIQKQWDTITNALVEILPDVWAFRPATTKDFKHYIEVKTDYGWVPLRQLSYGYQTMLAWVVDLAKRMIDAYPDSDTPLKESAVVLVDEIDLHLHPSWQRRIVGDLSRIFPNVQFIATSHSPLVVQSAERCNIAVLHKDGDRVHIRNYPDQSYQGWSVEEILRELMEMDSTHSEAFTQAMEAFEQALTDGDEIAARLAYDRLDQILRPDSVHRDLMRIQMSTMKRAASA